jgi:hypothetical protein
MMMMIVNITIIDYTDEEDVGKVQRWGTKNRVHFLSFTALDSDNMNEKKYPLSIFLTRYDLRAHVIVRYYVL